MLLLVVWLYVETQRAVNREMRQAGKVQYNLRKERCTYAIISFFFAISYIGRFVYNVFVDCGGAGQKLPLYAIEMLFVLVCLFEGVSMGVLMLFHWANF